MLYDFVVIGGGFGGLVTSAYLSKYGYNVALLEKHSTLGGCAGYFKKGDFKFEVGATTLNGLGSDGVLGKLVNDFDVELRFARQNPAMVSWFEGQSIRRYSDPDRWASELSRIAESYSLDSFCKMIDRKSQSLWDIAMASPIPPRSIGNLEAILKNGFWAGCSAAWNSLVPFTSVIPRDLRNRADFVNMINEQLLISAQGYMDEIPANVGILGLGYQSDLYYPVGGITCLAEVLADRIKNFGSEVSLNDSVRSINKLASGYEVISRKGVTRCKKLVFAIPIWNAAKLLDDSSIDIESFGDSIKEEDWRWGAATMYFGVKFEQEPPELYYQIHFPVEYPEIEARSMFVSLSAVGDLERAPNGYRTVTISTHVNTSGFEMDRKSAKYKECKQRLEDIIMSQFNEAFQQYGISDLKEIYSGTPKTFEGFTGRHMGSVGGIPWKAWQPIWNRIGNRLPLDNMYLVGDTALPGQGVSGVTLGAMHFSDGYR